MGKPFFRGNTVMYFKGKWCSTWQKEPLIGRFDSFQIRPIRKGVFFP